MYGKFLVDIPKKLCKYTIHGSGSITSIWKTRVEATFSRLYRSTSTPHWAIRLHPWPPQPDGQCHWLEETLRSRWPDDNSIYIYSSLKEKQSPNLKPFCGDMFLVCEVIRCHEIYTAGWSSHSVPSFFQLLTVSELISCDDWVYKLSTLP